MWVLHCDPGHISVHTAKQMAMMWQSGLKYIHNASLVYSHLQLQLLTDHTSALYCLFSQSSSVFSVKQKKHIAIFYLPTNMHICTLIHHSEGSCSTSPYGWYVMKKMKTDYHASFLTSLLPPLSPSFHHFSCPFWLQPSYHHTWDSSVKLSAICRVMTTQEKFYAFHLTLSVCSENAPIKVLAHKSWLKSLCLNK